MADEIVVKFRANQKNHRASFKPGKVTGVMFEKDVTPDFLSRTGLKKQSGIPSEVQIFDDKDQDVTAAFVNGPRIGVCYMVGFEVFCW